MYRILILGLCIFSNVRSEKYGNNLRLSNGIFARRGEIPYIALLNWNNGRDEFICGGTIISSTHILTSSFCTSNILEGKEEEVSIYVGTVFRSGSQGDLYKINRIFTHPDYNPTSYLNDIAVIKLTSNITFSEFVQPINLTTSVTYTGALARASGWGLTELYLPAFQLKYGVYEIQQERECKNYANKYYEDDKQMCGSAGRQAISAGDNGGPLVYEGSLVGVISKNGDKYECCNNELFFTKVLYYSDWIHETMLR